MLAGFKFTIGIMLAVGLAILTFNIAPFIFGAFVIGAYANPNAAMLFLLVVIVYVVYRIGLRVIGS